MVAEGIRVGRLSIAALALALVACDKGEDPNARHYSDAEIAELEARFLARAEANRLRHCVRPTLDGNAKPGSAQQAQLAVVEATGAAKTCLDKATKARAPLGRNRQVHLVPELHAIDDECGAMLEALVRESIAHEDACSPYVAGVRAMPMSVGDGEPLPNIISVTTQLAVRAWRQSDAKGLLLAAVGYRWSHDLARGHTNILTATLGLANRRLHDVAWELALTVPPESAAAVAPAFDTLIKTAPRFGSVLIGDTLATALQYALPYLKPVGWEPPGGLGEKLVDTPRDRNGTASYLELLDEKHAHITRYCGEGKSHAACFVQYVAHQTEAPNTGFWASYIQKAGLDLARLISIRIVLEVRRDGRCPTAEELASPRWIALRTSAVLGDHVDVRRDGATLAIRPPLWTLDDKPRELPWEIQCP